MKVVTWNVNSINVRLDRLKKLLAREEPDIVCLQELKCTDDKFPYLELKEEGFETVVVGQKTYNGVAILSKLKPDKIWRGMGAKSLPDEARLVGVQFGELTVVCVYCPNGQEVGSDKYRYKLKWFEQLRNFLKTQIDFSTPVLVCGDFNVAPQDEDVYDPKHWRNQILFSEPEKEALKSITDLGLKDLYRVIHSKGEGFTWWDYRNVSFPKNHGLRIDFILGSQRAVEGIEDAYVDRNERKGTQPSDHAPVICLFKEELLPKKMHHPRSVGYSHPKEDRSQLKDRVKPGPRKRS